MKKIIFIVTILFITVLFLKITTADIFLNKVKKAYKLSGVEDKVLDKKEAPTIKNDTIGDNENTGIYPHSVCQDIAWDPSSQIDEIINLMRNAGIKSIRMPFRWTMIEPTNDQYTWTVHDPIVQKLVDNNIEIVGQIIGVPSWANGKTVSNVPDGHWPDCYPPENTSDFSNYLNTIVNHYNEDIKSWIIFNEPNLDIFWRPSVNASEYVAFLKIAYTTIKSIDSSFTVIGAGLAGNGIYMGWETGDSRDFLQAMYDNGAKGYYDVISIHPYLHPSKGIEVLQSYIDDTISLMAANNDSARLWIGEIGWSTTPDAWSQPTVSINELANWLNDIYTKLSGVEEIFWYNFKDVGTDPDNVEHNFGLIDYNLNIKPTYTAFKNL